jgi:hypothetical protein
MNIWEAQLLVRNAMDSLGPNMMETKKDLRRVHEFLGRTETKIRDLNELLKVTEERAYGFGWGKGKDE